MNQTDETITVIRAAVFIPGSSEPSFTEINNSLESLQAIVGGYIELVRLTGDGLIAYVNEEGKLEGLPPVRRICWGSASQDVLCGPFVVCRDNHDGETVGINPDDEKLLKEWTTNSVWDVSINQVL